MKKKFIWTILALLPAFSCSKLIEIDPPINTIGTDKMFQNDEKANSALAALYSTMINTQEDNTLCFGGATLAGSLMADEVSPTLGSLDEIYNPLFNNNVLADNGGVMLLWKDGFKYIHIANTLIEGVAGSQSASLSDSARRQVTGEAKLVRAWTHLLLADYFGTVPMVLTSDVNQISQLGRAKPADLFAQMEADLKEAYNLLQPDFRATAGAKVRPSRDAATGLLARLYLYQGRWAEAEAEASKLIDGGAFALEPLAKTFKAGNREAIWQLKRVDKLVQSRELMESSNFVPQFRFSQLPPDAHFIWKDKASYEEFVVNFRLLLPAYTATPALYGAFEPGDGRQTVWMDSIPQPDDAPYYGKALHFIAKYRSEYDIEGADLHLNMQRLGEIYLIRAEARAQQGANLTGAAADLGAIRQRAGLEPTKAATKPALLDAILQERRVELFGEWGHRWVDLRRFGKTAGMAGQFPHKQPWADYKLLLPVPREEVRINPSLGQNPGYF